MPANQKPSIRFYHSKSLRKKTLKVIAHIEEAEDPTEHSGEFSDVVMELCDVGMNYWFIKPLELAKMNFVVRQSAQVGISSATKIVAPIIRGVIGRMDKKQLRTVVRFLKKHLE